MRKKYGKVTNGCIKDIIFDLIFSFLIGGKVASLDVDPCPQFPCPFQKGKNATITLKFSPTVDTSTLKLKFKGKIGMVWVPFPTPENACDDKECICPLTKEKKYTVSRKIFIQPVFPTVSI